jgi:membrane-associated phospholipid phosphatase
MQPPLYLWCVYCRPPNFMITRRKILLLVGVIVAVVVGLSTGLFGMGL